MATPLTMLCEFYMEYEDDARGYRYLRAELHATVCGALGVEVVVGSGGLATAISSGIARGVGGHLGAC